MEQHREKKNQMDRPHLETQWTRVDYNRKKNRGKSPKRNAKGQIHGQIKNKVRCEKYQEVSQLSLDRVGWRAVVILS
jgi:hypothetical protein